jgi:4-hydroxybenzoate polyprenyltransferase
MSRGSVTPALWRATRPHNGLACALLAWAGCGFPIMVRDPRRCLAMSATIILLAAAAHLANDIVDIAADRFNRPRRPLVNGRLGLAQARRATLILWLAGVLAGFLRWPAGWVWWGFWGVAGPGYSLWAKGRGWLAPVWTAATIASCYLAGAWLRDWRGADVPVVLVVTYFIVFREYVKNLEDLPGDSAAGLTGMRGLGGRRRRRYLTAWCLGAPLFLAGLCLVCPSPPGGWIAWIGAGFLICLLAAMASLSWASRPHSHLSGSLLKVGAFCGLGLLLVSRP